MKSGCALHRLVTPTIAAMAAFALSSLASTGQATPPTHDFGINNGLAKPTPLLPAAPALNRSTPDYTAELPDPLAVGARRRIELHWLPVPGTTRTRPALWEPGPRCLTLLRNAARIDAGNWVFSADVGAIPLANADCKPMRRIGALAGVDSLHVLIEARGEQLSYRIGVAVKSTPGTALPPMLQGKLRPSEAIATRKSIGRFGEKFLVEDAFRSLDEVYLVTPYGLFKGKARTASAGTGGFAVVSTTNLYRAFQPGELFFKVNQDSGAPLKMTLVQRMRTADGSRCPDTDGRPFIRILRLASPWRPDLDRRACRPADPRTRMRFGAGEHQDLPGDGLRPVVRLDGR